MNRLLNCVGAFLIGGFFVACGDSKSDSKMESSAENANTPALLSISNEKILR